MTIETVYTGKVWKFGDRISTDLMVPGAKVLANPNQTAEEAAQFCMFANRPSWSSEVGAGDILVAGINFGCGSSRNGSQPLQTLGVAVVIADSVSRIHLRNAVNQGLPTLVCPGISDFVEEGQELTVDILSGIVTNNTTGATIQAEAWEEGSPPYQILMAGGLNEFMKAKVVETGLVSA